MGGRTIDEVIAKLDDIITESIHANSTNGYFAALYRKVTIRVKEKLGTGFFDDDARMEELDVVFANRYLEAYSNYQLEDPVSASWKVAFEASQHDHLIVLQHLFLGMNAHINLDLGIAAVEVANGDILSLKSDFNRINELLGQLLDEVQKDLIQIVPWLKYPISWFHKIDDILANFSMETARKGAWTFALELSICKGGYDEAIALRDTKVANVANVIIKHGRFIRFLIKLIRWSEKGDVVSKIKSLKD